MSAPHSPTLVSRLEHWAQTIPDSPSVQYLDRSHSWREWRDRVRQLAGALASVGIGAGDSVAFVDKNNLACVEVTYAASALGAANAIPNFRLAGDELATSSATRMRSCCSSALNSPT